ncbi:EI24 domain-containing protein [Aliiroseovarius crassostreae]|uniref:EI24 domain-containing protein n=1 Tax=Aliiroseovarius crassostreae TaxID=154981 RepID=A0A9Q9H735_9RHOB|nr:EI24 domain-containing protein [Aliiroseovarius crassostreae]UWP88484.1 EI24 domain-containing protein [Aliiroseovarius crassostreae]UWP91648.1 EI24 domain-containing protein [Aliiroseovarius crassostreae]UWP94794.1 EI24 domain-containing protein [Aliiroseovarius crassostreae]UWP97955.1 EI24 domain-containing protein [Aliiroseovarius crassostreae]UWQ01139.1 EI24 domain-containing protein [Aliiroseovarius crassostreae]
MIDDFFRALAQLSDPRFRKVLLKGLGLTVGLLVAITWVMVTLVGFVIPDVLSLPFVGEVSFVGGVAMWVAALLMIVLSAVLMVPVAGAFTGLFLDEVADAVEARHYPHLAPNAAQPISAAIRESLGFFGVIVGVNLVALILFFFVGPLAPILFYAVNGYLLGREYFTMAAMRRMEREAAHALRKRHNTQIWIAGILMAVPLSIPLVNLLIPILGAATFTHMFQRLSGR